MSHRGESQSAQWAAVEPNKLQNTAAAAKPDRGKAEKKKRKKILTEGKQQRSLTEKLLYF